MIAKLYIVFVRNPKYQVDFFVFARSHRRQNMQVAKFMSINLFQEKKKKKGLPCSLTIAAIRLQADKQKSDNFRPSYITVATEANSQYVKSISKDEVVQKRKKKICLESFSIFPLSIQNFCRRSKPTTQKISSSTIAKGRWAPLLHPQRGAAR